MRYFIFFYTANHKEDGREIAVGNTMIKAEVLPNFKILKSQLKEILKEDLGDVEFGVNIRNFTEITETDFLSQRKL